MIAPPVVAQAVWMADDFTPLNGATRVVPGSHLSGRQPNPEESIFSDTVPLAAPAGCCVVYDGRLWHGTGSNISEGEDRLGIFATYCAPQFRAQENSTLATDPEVFETLSDKVKALLGFKIWQGYGRVGAPAAGLIKHPQQTDLRVGVTARRTLLS